MRPDLDAIRDRCLVDDAGLDVPSLLIYIAELERERDEALVIGTRGHAETCAGMDEANGRCGCGWLQGEGAHRVLVEWRTRAERLESERDRLRAALEPFVAIAGALRRDGHVTTADILRAVAALEAFPAPGGGA